MPVVVAQFLVVEVIRGEILHLCDGLIPGIVPPAVRVPAERMFRIPDYLIVLMDLPGLDAVVVSYDVFVPMRDPRIADAVPRIVFYDVIHSQAHGVPGYFIRVVVPG